MSQPKVLARFDAMVGGKAAFDPAGDDGGAAGPQAGSEDAGHHGGPETGRREDAGRRGGRGLPSLLAEYLDGEQRLGRIDPAAGIGAAASLIVGAMHGQILPKVLFAPPGTPVTMPPDRSARLADVVLRGIAPGARHT